jgi:hypothetical protein
MNHTQAELGGGTSWHATGLMGILKPSTIETRIAIISRNLYRYNVVIMDVGQKLSAWCQAFHWRQSYVHFFRLTYVFAGLPLILCEID